MDRQSVDIRSTWAELVPLLDMILNIPREDVFLKNTINVLSKADYMTYYYVVFQYCTKSSSSNSSHPPVSDPGSQVKIYGKELYDKLREYLIIHNKMKQKELSALRGEELLDKYRYEWELYDFTRSIINNVFRYLNKHAVRTARESGLTNYFPIYHLTVFIWREYAFKPLANELTTAALEMIRKDREGIQVRTSALKSFTQSLVAMGLDNEEQHVGLVASIEFVSTVNLQVYEQFFEQLFVEDTRNFYERECTTFATSGSIADYVKKVLERVEEEDARVRQYMHESTASKVADACNHVMIVKHQDSLNAEAATLLDEEKDEDLKRLYALLRRVPTTLGPLRQQVEMHITKQARTAIEACGKLGTSSEDAKTFVETLLQIHSKYIKQIELAFLGDALFVEALDKALRTVVNNNAVTQAARNSGRTPELLAKYCDSLLKKGSKVEGDQLDERLTQIMIIFKYLEDKDIFEKFYKKFLAKRLVTGQSASDDAETAFLSKLKAASGHEYTNKLQRMFNDIGTSRELNAKFKQHLANSSTSLGVDFQVQVLTSHSWPFSAQGPMTLPPLLTRCLDRFTMFYQNEHQGRKLSWAYHLCKGELMTHYLKKPFVFQANLMQMAILLQFNNELTISRSQLESATGIEDKQLEPQLENLSKMKILKQEEDQYTLNDKYSYKKLKIKIDQPIKSEQKEESETTHKTAAEDRKLVVQACIVRIMKMRRRLSHTALMQEVIEQLQSRFKPDVSLIKKMIELLIDKEYLRRGEVRTDYEYVA
eukprot:m.94756 g.94756  ORF g.94756 m.94756 type:complete len:768 (+) comp14738_c0_seq1:451-2754(+)